MHVAHAECLIRYPLIAEVNVEMVQQIFKYYVSMEDYGQVDDLPLILDQIAVEIVLKKKVLLTQL